MSIDVEMLKNKARNTTGLEDFGPDPLDEGLHILARSIEQEAGLNAAGRTGAIGQISSVLEERLRLQSCWSEHPEILEQQLPFSIMVVGLPRTGTTALSQFLSEDPNARSIRRWEARRLTPPPDATVTDDPRVAETEAAFERRDALMPKLRKALPVGAQDPTEHSPLQGLTFFHPAMPTLYDVPSYEEWILSSDGKPSYAYMAKVLKLLQWKTPAAHWNLKCPLDLFWLPEIREVFPNSRLIWTHRDPVEVIASVCSLAEIFRQPTVDSLDLRALGPKLLNYYATGVDRAMAARAALGEHHFIDSYQRELGNDTAGTIANIYNQLGLPFTQTYADHLQSRMANRPRGQFGKHEYALSDYGLDQAEVRERFAGYIERFGL
jgi:hypothetical protein